MLATHDFDGFNDRHMAIICIKREPVMFEDMVQPPEGTLRLGYILEEIRKTNDTGRVYIMDGVAKETFAVFYNSIERRMDEVCFVYYYSYSHSMTFNHFGHLLT